MTEQHAAGATRSSKKHQTKPIGISHKSLAIMELTSDGFGLLYAKRTQFRVVKDGTLKEDAGWMRKGSATRVMAVLRSLNIDLCTVSGKASLAAANRHDMCNLEKPVEPVSIPNRE